MIARVLVQDSLILTQVMEAYRVPLLTDAGALLGRQPYAISRIKQQRATMSSGLRLRCLTLLVHHRSVELARNIEHERGHLVYADLFCAEAVKVRGSAYLSHLSLCVRCQAKLLIDKKKVPPFAKATFHSRER